MLTRREVLNKWAKEWFTLKAWKRDLSNVEITISDENNQSVLGTCWPLEQSITIYRAVEPPKLDLPTELDTLIHELAHAATIEEGHSHVWQATYSRAIVEVTKICIPLVADKYRTVGRAGRQAVKTWWNRSGNEFLVKLAGVSW